MHTTIIGNTTFIHHGSYEGEVEIIHKKKRFFVPFNDLKGFVADYVCGLRIEKLEQASADEILGVTNQYGDVDMPPEHLR